MPPISAVLGAAEIAKWLLFYHNNNYDVEYNTKHVIGNKYV